MTSGKFKSFPLDQIVINRPERQRRELDRIPELAESISRIGLIHPPVISRDGTLRVGERRVSAARLLGWTHIPVQFAEEMDDGELQLLELEENTRRVDLPWQDQCFAIDRYHKLRLEQDNDWTAIKTAEALGMTQTEVGQKRAVVRELEQGNQQVIDAPKFSVARGIVTREQERKRASTIEKVLDAPEEVVPILNEDFLVWQPAYTGPKFNFIHCDFPYGIRADKQQQGVNVALMRGYEDTPDIYWGLLECLGSAMENVVAESAHLMFWFSLDYYTATLKALQNAGWTVSPFPLIWHKSDNAGMLPDPSRGPRRVYETCFMGSRGDRKIVRSVSNLISSPTTKLIHMSEKPLVVLTHFYKMFIDEYSIVLDPTCGGATALRAATAAGAHSVLGLEIDKKFYDLAKEHFRDD